MTTTWTNLPKPSPTTSVITQVFSGGDPIGLLLALTNTSVSTTSVLTGIWTDVTKASGTTYTNVAKAT